MLETFLGENAPRCSTCKPKVFSTCLRNKQLQGLCRHACSSRDVQGADVGASSHPSRTNAHRKPAVCIKTSMRSPSRQRRHRCQRARRSQAPEVLRPNECLARPDLESQQPRRRGRGRSGCFGASTLASGVAALRCPTTLHGKIEVQL